MNIRVLSEEMKKAGFIKKGRAFFRTQGENILVTVRLEREPGYLFRMREALCFGLESLYSELSAFELTGKGCVARYPVMLLREENISAAQTKEFVLDDIYNMDAEEYELLMNTVLPFLSHIQTQKELVLCMRYLEEIEYGKERPLGMEKYAPLLYLEEYDAAWMIIKNYLCQWNIPELIWEDKDAVLSCAKKERDRETLLRLYSCAVLAVREDRAQCLQYLNHNLERNLSNLQHKRDGSH